jgi:hypothetical protein
VDGCATPADGGAGDIATELIEVDSLVFCDATRAFDSETRSFNDFTASAGHDDGHNVVPNDWFGDDGAL